MKVVTMTAYRRPGYTKTVLDALMRCEGVQDWALLVNVDPSDRNVERLFAGLPFEVVVNRTRLGCAQNTLAVLTRGFELAEYVVHLEDDTVPAPDALTWFASMEVLGHDDDVWTVAGWRRGVAQRGEERAYRRFGWFHCWGWATWRDRFEEMLKAGWPEVAWGHHAQRVRGGRVELQPLLSRMQNIGRLEGQHVLPEKHEEQVALSWAGDVSSLGSGPWWEVDNDGKP